MQTMWQFNSGRFTIMAQIEPCDSLDLSWDESGETRDDLESGALEAFNTRVSVWLNGAIIGENWLCESIYSDPAEFFAGHRGADPMNRNCSIMRAAWRGEGNPDAKVSICHYFPGMVQEAIADARRWLAGAGIARAA